MHENLCRCFAAIVLAVVSPLQADDRKLTQEQILAKREFFKVYALDEGEHVKWVRPPYQKCRGDYIKKLWMPGNDQKGDVQYGCSMFFWQDGDVSGMMGMMSSIPGVGSFPLRNLLEHGYQIRIWEIEGDGDVLGTNFQGDVVLRRNAPKERLGEQLAALFKEATGKKARIEFREVEKPVYVLRGTWKFTPLIPKANCILLVGSPDIDRKDISYPESGDFKALVSAVEGKIDGRVVLDEIEGAPKSIEWRWHSARGLTTRDIEALHRDPEKIMDMFARQTGLKVSKDTRKVKVLFAEKAD